MINLTKIGRSRSTAPLQAQIDEIKSYLNRLVPEIEKALPGRTAAQESVNTVKDISIKDGNIIVYYTDGSVKRLSIE